MGTERRYIHKHWIALLPQVWWMPLGAFSLLLGWQIFAAVMAIVFARLWWVHTDWRNDMYVLGDGQLTQVRKLPLGMNEDREGITLDKITGTKTELGGMMQRWLGYGTVVVLTANEQFNMRLEPIVRPSRAQELIQEFMTKEKRNDGRFFSNSAD